MSHLQMRLCSVGSLWYRAPTALTKEPGKRPGRARGLRDSYFLIHAHIPGK